VVRIITVIIIAPSFPGLLTSYSLAACSDSSLHSPICLHLDIAPWDGESSIPLITGPDAHPRRHRPLGFQIILAAFQHDKPFALGFRSCLCHLPLAFAPRYVSLTFYSAVNFFPAQLQYTNPSSLSNTLFLEESLSSGGHHDFFVMFEYVFCFFFLASCRSYRLHLHIAHVLEELARMSLKRPRLLVFFLPRPFPL